MVTFNDTTTLQRNSPWAQRCPNYCIAVAQLACLGRGKHGPSALQLQHIPRSAYDGVTEKSSNRADFVT